MAAKLTANEIDVLQELINIGVGTGAEKLNRILSSHITLQAPQLQVLTLTELVALLSTRRDRYLTSVAMTFSGSFSGSAALVFPENAATSLVGALVGDGFYDEDIDSLYKGVVIEIGNIVLNGVMGTISNLADSRLRFGSPHYLEVTGETFLTGKEDPHSIVLFVETTFHINRLDVTGGLVIILEVESIEALVTSIHSHKERGDA